MFVFKSYCLPETAAWEVNLWWQRQGQQNSQAVNCYIHPGEMAALLMEHKIFLPFFPSAFQSQRKLQTAVLKEGIPCQKALREITGGTGLSAWRAFAGLPTIRGSQLVLCKEKVSECFLAPAQNSEQLVGLNTYHSFSAAPTVFAICMLTALAL